VPTPIAPSPASSTPIPARRVEQVDDDPSIVTDAPDPLGKRALFWAPAERDEDGPRRASERAVPGKHALFSDEARAAAAGGLPGVKHRPVPGQASRRASFSPSSLGKVTVHCSSCKARSEVGLPEFALLHLPVWMWWPGRSHTRFMTCPACRRRTWVRASWAFWNR
jgi:hypothetical protein